MNEELIDIISKKEERGDFTKLLISDVIRFNKQEIFLEIIFNHIGKDLQEVEKILKNLQKTTNEQQYEFLQDFFKEIEEGEDIVGLLITLDDRLRK